MTLRPTALLLVAAALALTSAPALAQGAAEPTSKTDAARTPRAKKRPAKPAARAAAAPSTRSPLLGQGGGEDEAASLERRRKAFFAKQPDAGGPDQPETPPAGVTLGGSGGITPGMGFKF